MSSSATALSPLPHLYGPWVEAVLGEPAPEERHATCSSCAMCEPAAERAATASLTLFDKRIKCCTYVPTLPNFLVGMILNDGDAAAEVGRASVERRIAKGVGVTPLGLQADPQYSLIYKHAGEELFGRSPGLRCPHYLSSGGGLCGIWQHRNAVCATWFCKHERGRTGKRFWEAVRQLLVLVERHLALWAATELGEPITVLGPSLLTYYATTLPAPEIQWSRRWAGIPEEFYRVSARLVEPLSWQQVCEIGGCELSLLAGHLRAAFRAMHSNEVPDYLRFVDSESKSVQGGARALLGYSSLDLPILPAAVANALPQFTGQRQTDEASGTVDGTLFVDRATILTLVDFEVLVPAKGPDARR